MSNPLLTPKPVQVTLSDGATYEFTELDAEQYVEINEGPREMLLILMGEVQPFEVATHMTSGLLNGLSICTRIPLAQIKKMKQHDIVRITMGVSEANAGFFVSETLPVLIEATSKAGARKTAAIAEIEQVLAGLKESLGS